MWQKCNVCVVLAVNTWQFVICSFHWTQNSSHESFDNMLNIIRCEQHFILRISRRKHLRLNIIPRHFIALGMKHFSVIRRKIERNLYRHVLPSNNTFCSTLVKCDHFASTRIFNEWTDVLILKVSSHMRVPLNYMHLFNLVNMHIFSLFHGTNVQTKIFSISISLMFYPFGYMITHSPNHVNVITVLRHLPPCLIFFSFPETSNTVNISKQVSKRPYLFNKFMKSCSCSC